MTPARARQLLDQRDSTPSTVISKTCVPFMMDAEVETLNPLAIDRHIALTELVGLIAAGKVKT